MTHNREPSCEVIAKQEYCFTRDGPYWSRAE